VFVFFSACTGEQKPAQKQSTQKTQNVKKPNSKKKGVSPYWAGIEKQISLSKTEIKAIKKIQNNYKQKINKLKKQKKYNKNHKARFETLRANEIKKLIGEDKFNKYEKFNDSWSKR